MRRLKGQKSNAATRERIVHASGNPLLEARTKLEEAERLRLEGQFGRAQRICERILEHFPGYVAALQTIGLVLADRHEYDRALPYLVQAVMLNPKDWKGFTALSGVYLRLDAHDMATATLEQALARNPDAVDIMITLGEIHRENRDYEAAARVFRRALAREPSVHDVNMGLGNACVHLGELSEAAAAYSKLLPHRPDSINLLYSICELPPSLVNVDVLSLIERASPQEEDLDDFESSRSFTWGAALHRAGRYSEAWEKLLEANRYPYSRLRDAWQREAKLQEAVLAATRGSAAASLTHRGDDPSVPISLFILGPSRSGKTTMERLAGAIDGVKRGYENRIVENSVGFAFKNAALPTRHQILEMPPALEDLFQKFYLEELEERAGQAQVFTNTTPGHIGGALRLASIIPSTRFIFVKRDLEDVTLRIFMKKYHQGNAYAYDIGTIREHVTWYYEMIDILADRLADNASVVHYEDVIANPAAAATMAAELCGLDPPGRPVPETGDDRRCSVPYRSSLHRASTRT